MNIASLLKLQEHLGSRLKAARQALGWTQAQLAELGEVSKVTQSSYETGQTEPTTAYLRSIQSSGIDLNEVLYGVSSSKLEAFGGSPVLIDWSRLQQAFEDVEFFCQRFAPECPSTYKWKMVAKIYENSRTLTEASASQSREVLQAQTMRTLSDVWQELGRA
ncbi:helix-turn-helix domain-containing protein [Comamonas guangdongensis]|uniref:Helix-turn-helix domain-containing protein n=1 Tax=Comamonas guangdongensis TaxID=510515 RepID=A0ABV4A0A2_9BURK